MKTDRSTDYLISLVNELRKLPAETGWVEFKHNNADPEAIGEYISALANSAALAGKASAYLVWGVEDGSHAVVGTSFNPIGKKVGNEELENWLLKQMEPRIHFRFDCFAIEEMPVVLLEISRTLRHPVRFNGKEFIRVGSYKKRLKDYPETERELWRIFDQTPFERLLAAENLAIDEVLRRLDYPAYFDLFGRPLPEGREGILAALEADAIVQRNDAAGWGITNLGAILLAKRLTDFEPLGRKAVRVIEYEGKGRTRTLHEQVGAKGYANGFEGLIAYINSRVPANEVIEQALRKTVPMYPELAIRELVANAMIHQDFCITGAGPTVEIFSDRMEITNPGQPLVDPARFLDNPPRSRNEALASFLRRVGVCEERGSGIDKVVFQTEYYQLPAPRFEVAGDNTIAVLFAQRPLTRMDKDDRVRACYLHACLRYVERDFMTNSTLRERFGIERQNSAQASRLIKEATEAQAIRAYDAAASRRDMKYVPWWAG
jgi:ATP-dependent DNA helicase RecG